MTAPQPGPQLVGRRITLLLLVACAPQNSCAEYVAAAGACTESAGGDAAAYDEESICGDWTAEKEASYGDWYQCQADAWSASSCATTEDVSAAVDAASACPAG